MQEESEKAALLGGPGRGSVRAACCHIDVRPERAGETFGIIDHRLQWWILLLKKEGEH